jgi:hypothetical protein
VPMVHLVLVFSLSLGERAGVRASNRTFPAINRFSLTPLP